MFVYVLYIKINVYESFAVRVWWSLRRPRIEDVQRRGFAYRGSLQRNLPFPSSAVSSGFFEIFILYEKYHIFLRAFLLVSRDPPWPESTPCDKRCSPISNFSIFSFLGEAAPSGNGAFLCLLTFCSFHPRIFRRFPEHFYCFYAIGLCTETIPNFELSQNRSSNSTRHIRSSQIF